MNTSLICRALVPFWLVLGVSSMPCHAQQPVRSQNEVERLREAVARLERENLELRSALAAREQEIAELSKSQREAIAALRISHETQEALRHEVLAILRELHATVMRQEARMRGKEPLPKPPAQPPAKPPAEDPFARKPKTAVPERNSFATSPGTTK